MNRKLGVVILLFCFLHSPISQSQEEQTVGAVDEELDYMELVMNIFRHHVKALELLSSTESKYSDNIVNHAQALWQTSGFLDHLYPEADAVSDHTWPWKSEQEFEERVAANREATVELQKAAGEWLEGGERENLVNAIENVKESCRNCHGEARDWP